MDESAIKRIEELASAGCLETHYPSIVVPSGCSVQSLEKFGVAPVRQRVKLRTESIEEFCDYIAREGDGDSVVLVNPDGSGATCILDFGCMENPLFKEHRIRLTLDYTPEFQALLDICRRPVSQQDLIDFIEDWSYCLTTKAGEDALALHQAVAAIRKVTIESIQENCSEVADFASSASALAKVSAKSGDWKLPGMLNMECKAYDGTSTLSVPCRISVLTSEKAPTFRLRIVGLKSIESGAAAEVLKQIDNQVDVPVFQAMLD